ncbi:hypothetical protein SAMN04489806_2397 [Paramicrobacterium humi]|uniref:Uncharacterized protein n=1 Tax=Paramicrobacterium humi TaxID=640635 RepID=A0A1H4P4U8_9MICO|nr:hypothetical protein SAMN04489806_2397 [Microbacterium humi]
MLAALLALEALAMIAVLVVLLVDLATLRPDSYASAVALVVIAAIAAIWLCAVTLAFWRGRAWSRAGAFTWQVIQVAVAIGAFQGAFAQPGIGWAILLPSLLGVVLLLTRSVIQHTRRA